MQYTETLNATGLDMTKESAISFEPRLNYFSIWMATFRLFRKHIGLLFGATVLLGAPFFVLNGMLHAHHMMTLGSAGMTQTEIPQDQMRVLWLSLVCGDTLSFIALSMATLLVFKYLFSEPQTGFARHALQELGRLCRSFWFWLFVPLQFLIFVVMNSPEGQFKLGGMLLFAASVLLFLASQDRDAPAYGKRMQQMRWTGWVSLVLVLLTFPALFIFLNGFADYLLLMLMDMGAGKLLNFFEPGSSVLPFITITLSKFISQWFNLLPMALLMCTYAAMRVTSTKS